MTKRKTKRKKIKTTKTNRLVSDNIGKVFFPRNTSLIQAYDGFIPTLALSVSEYMKSPLSKPPKPH